ncbi:MAG: hypothetical protein ACON4T_09490 [Synechococcus sp.]
MKPITVSTAVETLQEEIIQRMKDLEAVIASSDDRHEVIRASHELSRLLAG